MDNEPKWTVLANIVSKGSRWIGNSWEFFEDEPTAQARYDDLVSQGNCPTKRPFHRSTDLPHMHVIDQRLVGQKVLSAGTTSG